MASIILTGATGTAGSDALRQAIRSPLVSRITVLSRRALPGDLQDHAKVNVILHSDFTKYPPTLLEQLEGHNACLWCLGRSIRGVTAQDYTVITKDYTLAAAKAFASLTSATGGFRFVYVSSLGATWSPGFFSTPYARIKGETEKELAHLPAAGYPSLSVHNCRPCFIRPTVARPEVPLIVSILKPLWTYNTAPRSSVIDSADLGEAMLRMALPKEGSERAAVEAKGGPTEEGVWSNWEMRQLVEL